MTEIAEIWNVIEIKKSKKKHRCDVCRVVIPVDNSYVKINWVCGGEAGTYYLHDECHELYERINNCIQYDYECISPCEVSDEMDARDEVFAFEEHKKAIIEKYIK